jgi:hypothetical protein
MFLRIGLFLLFAGCFFQDKRPVIFLIKQWHPTANVVATDLKQNDNIPQAKNQIAIYSFLNQKVQNSKIDQIVVEGCEGEVNENFTPAFYGWDYKKLQGFLSQNSEQYQEVISHIGLKLEVFFKEKLLTICGDNLELVKKHSLAFSDARAFLGYWQRLQEFKEKGNTKSFETYKLALLKDTKTDDPIHYAKLELTEAIKSIEHFSELRNQKFFEVISKLQGKVGVVIGGDHALGLKKLLEKKGYDAQIVELEGYPVGSDNLIDELKKQLNI